MKQLILFAFLITSNSLHAAASCWEVGDKMEQAMREAEGSMQLLFRDAVNCQPIPRAKIQFLGETFTTDRLGAITFPVPPDNLNTSMSLSTQKDGYIDYHDQITVAAGSVWQTRYLLSPKLPAESARFVLSWGASPKDLDLHLKSENMHISYRNMNSYGSTAQLDIDALQGFGPETITLNRVDQNQYYQLLVHQYSSAGAIQPPARVAIYTDGSLQQVVRLQNNRGRCLSIAEIVNGEVEINPQSVQEMHCR